jgi:uncharacterized damage-inducible protein DinB
MNQRLYGVLSALSHDELVKDRGGYFKSLFGTLQHLMFGDHFILTRVRAVSGQATALDEMAMQWEFEPDKSYADDLASLRALRERVDAALVRFADGLTAELLDKRSAGPGPQMPLWVLLQHLFHHQTHHRGQLTTLMTQAGLEYGVTGFIDSYHRGLD